MTVIVCLSCCRYEDRASHALFCFVCSEQRHVEAGRAIGLVAKTVKQGTLAPPSDFDCADCGKPAKNYDHRDYTKPLEVTPVCRSCNGKRGPALDSQMRDIPDCYAQPA